MKNIQKILIINTGGTFNKVYNPSNGTLDTDTQAMALNDISKKWHHHFEIKNIIGKDSLEISDDDRKILLDTISHAKEQHIIVIHGTDTMDITAHYIGKAKLEKCIVFTGAMVPHSIDPVEATANLASAYGYLQALEKKGVYIAMNGIIDSYAKVKKDRQKGYFSY